MPETIPLCRAGDLVDGGEAVPFDVLYGGQTCRAFAVRYEGEVHAYLNRCAHVAMEMDFSPTGFLTAAVSGSCVPPTVRCMSQKPGNAGPGPAAVAW